MLIKDLSKEEIIKALEEDRSYLCYIPEERQDKDIIIAGVKMYGGMLKYASFQDEDICLEAVKSNGVALDLVKEQTREICFEAVKQNGQALEFVQPQNQNEEMCLMAVKQCEWALEYASIQTDEICKAAVRNSVFNIEYIKIPVSFEYHIHQLGDVSDTAYTSQLYAAKVDDTWIFGYDYIRDKTKEEFIEILGLEEYMDISMSDQLYKKEFLDILANY